MIANYCIIGGGIIGFATAMELIKAEPKAKILLLEKESCPGSHQTGHNSGVIHAGIYYSPGSLKARLCRQGLEATKVFCNENTIPFKTCGKLIVATNQQEQERIENLYDRATNNGLTLDRLTNTALKQIEPHITGCSALLSYETAIVNYHQICECLAEIITNKGVLVKYKRQVTDIEEHGNYVDIHCKDESFKAQKLITCAGLQADRIVKMSGLKVNFRIVPFRGEYYQLPQHKSSIVKHLIYPAPDPSLPFLGIHLTPLIDGRITVGPNAVLGFAREGYPKGSFSLKDSLDFARFPGFWKLIYKYKNHAVKELAASLSKKLYLKECQKYCPSLTLEDLKPFRSGIRAQVVDSSGEAIHDFLFKKTDRILHVCNAPSPAATSAIPIAAMIKDQCLTM